MSDFLFARSQMRDVAEAIGPSAAIAQVTLILVGLSLARYPHCIMPDLSLTNSADPPATLKLLTIALCAGTVLLLPSLVYLFRIFKGVQSE